MLSRYLVAEILKLRRSLALLLCLAAPAGVVLLSVLMTLDRKHPSTLPNFVQSSIAFWAFAMLPLTVTALSVLLAQTEHGPRSWDHLLALPGARLRVPLAKALVMLALVVAMTALLLGAAIGAGNLLAVLVPAKLAAAPLPPALFATTAGIAAAAALMAMLQLWTALRFHSFVPPLVLGIAGTFVAVAATSSRYGMWFPWLLPVNLLATDPSRAAIALWLGAGGGLVALAAMTAHLARREAIFPA